MHRKLHRAAKDTDLSATQREDLVLANLNHLDGFPMQFVWDVAIGLLRQERVTDALQIICHPAVKLSMQTRINGLINQYGLHLRDARDIEQMRDAIHANIINHRNITHFTEKVLTVCLTQGWLEEAKGYADRAITAPDVLQNPFRLAYYSQLRILMDLVIAETDVAQVNACICETLDCLIDGDEAAEFVKAANLLTAMHYSKTHEDTAAIKANIVKLVAHYQPSPSEPKLTVSTDFSTHQGTILLHQDTDFADRMKAAITQANPKQVTLVFCSGAYLEYFKVFWANNHTYLGQVVVVSLDDDAKAWFDENPDVIHVNESIYNGATDFGFYLWRKRFEAVNAILECDVDVCLCGIDSLLLKSAITHFASLPFDIIAGEGPGLPFSAVKSHLSLNCDMLFLRASDGVRKLMDEVLDYCGVYLQDQSSLNIIAARNGAPAQTSEHEGVTYRSYETKHGVTLACATGDFMVRQRRRYDKLKNSPNLWVFQPSDKAEILLMAEQGETRC